MGYFGTKNPGGAILQFRCIQGYLSNKIRILVTHQVNYLRNAPQILLLRKSPQELQLMVEELRTASSKVGLEINLSKTKVMFNRNVEIQPIMTGNVALDQVDRYIYLGQLISIHRDWEPENERPTIGTYDMLLEECPELTTFFTDTSKEKKISKELKNNEQVQMNDKKKDELANLDNFENATSKSVPFKVYKEFFKAAGNPLFIIPTSLLLNFIYASLIIGFDYWIKTWTDVEEERNILAVSGKNVTGAFGNDFGSFISSLVQDTKYNVVVLAFITICGVIFSVPPIMFDIMCCVRAARHLHDRMFDKLLHAPIKFFNTNPIGEILNRFTKDIGHIDDLIPLAYQDFVCVRDNEVYLRLSGGCFGKLLSHHNNCGFEPDGAFSWNTSSASSTGFLISQLANIALILQWRIRTTIELQSKQFTSVERVMEYGEIESEADREGPEEDNPPDDWPHNGDITAYNMSLSYSKDKLALKDVCFTINGGQKVGVVGRTGAGKTSLVNAIFRLEEPEGCLEIDGINISKIGLHKLRKNLSIIPQEPVLFQNTVRYNLDPFNVYGDERLWSALERVELKSVIGQYPEKLDTKLTEGQFSLSFGQQQLICLARATLRENKIIVMDEATSNVDVITDKIIQNTIRTRFKDYTVITIAHRIHTIIDSDLIIFLENGEIAEINSPKNLVLNKNSKFYNMILETGSAAPFLIKQAMNNHHKSYETAI
ncbi:putative multidrug resistance-associated protein lethal(2)03659 [Nymphon striatum]|nr:putative multidrug resistance-associated protein lethal(2)03659 [Nymphon striatum]